MVTKNGLVVRKNQLEGGLMQTKFFTLIADENVNKSHTYDILDIRRTLLSNLVTCDLQDVN